MNENLPESIRIAIVKGAVSDYSATVARINGVNIATLIVVLREIAAALEKA